MRVKILGPVEVERDGATLVVGGPQQRRLLALLVVNRGRAVSTDRLVDALWPDGAAPDGAARSIRTYLSRLRVVLPAGSITTNGAGYVLEPSAIDVDADEFEHLLDEADRAEPDVALAHHQAARALWRDVPFGEFTDEWWSLAEAVRLVKRRLLGDEQRAAVMMSIGHHNRAIPELEHLVAEQPLRERPVQLLMQALHVTGRRAEALRAGAAFRARLADETGLTPSPDLARLESSILTDDDLTSTSPERPLRGYVIHGAIGEGSHGRVYEATQPGTDRRVAIKVIRPDLADSAEFVRRFEAEARLVARLEHPHVVPLYDYWREPGGAYLVFRLLTGGTARDVVVIGGPWSLDRVSRLVEEIGGALIAAHASGVAHNDVRTSNVLLDADGGAFLTDFGIAVAAGDRTVEHEAERGDVRDLAWLVWELLTGSRQSPDRSTGTVKAGGGPTPSLVGRVEDLPEGLDALLEHASSADGHVRSVAEFVLGWRAATGQVEGARSPLTSSDRRDADSSRRIAARRLALATSAGVNPYRGLQPFDEADAGAFYGRAEVVDDLIAAVVAESMVTVVGASGSGKSSVVRAGLIPRLRAGGAVVATMVPGDDPIRALQEAWREVATADVDAGAAVGALSELAHGFGRMILVIDQLEECWTRASAERREAFFDVVSAMLTDSAGRIRVVATVRADLLDRPLAHPRIGAAVGAGAIVLPPMSAAGLAESIVNPAERVGVRFEDGVVADLVAEAAAQPGSLPLLQFALTELYDRRVDGVIGRQGLVAIGGLAGAIGRRAEATYDSLDDAARTDARHLFARLVIPDRDVTRTRRRARLGELSAGMRTVADRFVATRLLVTDCDPATREPTLDLAHEALLTRWSRLAGWVDEDGRWLEQVQHLSAASRSWEDGGRQETELYRGARLEAAIEAVDGEGRVVARLEQEFLDAGRKVRDAELVTARRTARRLRRRLTAVAVTLVIALVAGALALLQRSSARDSANRARAAESAALVAADNAMGAERAALIEALVGRIDSLRGTQRDTAALLAIEAYRLADTPRTRSALFGTFTDDERFLDAHRFAGDRGSNGVVMPDGKSAYLTGRDGLVHGYDLDAGTFGDPLPAVGEGDPFPVLAASPDGDRLVIAARSDPAGGPTTVGVVDTTTKSLIFPPTVVDGSVTSAAFLPGGRVALGWGEAGDVVIVDGTTGAVQATVPGVAIEADDVVWTQDPASGGIGRVLRRPSAVASAGDDLLVGSADGSLRVLDATTLEVRRTLDRPAETVSALWPLSDGTVVASGRLGLARLDLATGALGWERAEFGRCLSLTVAETDDLLFCGDPYGRLEALDLNDGAVLRRLDAQNGSSGSLWLAASGAELVSFGTDEAVVSRWRLDGSGPVTTVVAPGWTPVDFDATGQQLLVEQGDALADTYRWALVDPTGGDVRPGPDNIVVPSWTDADSLLGIGLGPDGDIEFAHTHLANGTPTGELTFAAAAVQRVEHINDLGVETGKQRMLIRYRDGTANALTTFDPDTLRYGPTIEVDGLISWAIDRAGDRVVAGTPQGVVVYDAHTGDVLDTLDAPDLRAVIVTVTDQLFVGSRGGELTQYDLDTLEAIREFGGSRGLVFDGASTADGSLIAVNGGDGVAALFDVASGIQLGGPITIAPDERNLVRLSLDGRWLAVGGQPTAFDAIVASELIGPRGAQVWDLDPTSWIRAACDVAGRNLTDNEWSTHIGALAPYRQTCPDLED